MDCSRSVAPGHRLRGRSVSVITVSDRCAAGTQTDISGPTLIEQVRAEGGVVVSSTVVPDEQPQIIDVLKAAAAGADLVLTTGGTGLAARDVTPEATLAVCDRLAPGLAELIRSEGARQTALAWLSRSVAGVRGQTLILNLPGSPAGAESSFAIVLPLLPHALDLLAGKSGH